MDITPVMLAGMSVVNLEWLSEFWDYVVGRDRLPPDHPWRDLNPDDEAAVARFAREGLKPALQDLPPPRRGEFATALRYAADHLGEAELRRYLTGALPPFGAPKDSRAFYRTILRETFRDGPEGPFEVCDDPGSHIHHLAPPGPPSSTGRSFAVANPHREAEKITGEPPAARGAAKPESVAALYRAVLDEFRRQLPNMPVETRLRAQLERAAQRGVSAAAHLDFLLEGLVDDPRSSPENLLTVLDEDAP